MQIKSKYMLYLFGLLFLLTTSCAAVVAGGAGAAAAYTYTSGWLTRDYNTTLEQAYRASIKTFRQNKIEVVEESKQISSATVKAETQEQTYWVKLESKGDKLTSVSVRAGLMGDESAARTIQEDIESNL